MKKHLLISQNIPSGRITEIFGDVDTGKSSTVLKIIGTLTDKPCLYIDVDRDLTQQKLVEFDVQDIITVLQPDTVEQVIDVIDHFFQHSIFNILVIDSTANLISEQYKQLPIDQLSWKQKVTGVTTLVRKLLPLIEAKDVITIFVSQVRKDLQGNSYTTGGKALRFYSTVRLEISRDDIIVVKNRTELPLLRESKNTL